MMNLKKSMKFYTRIMMVFVLLFAVGFAAMAQGDDDESATVPEDFSASLVQQTAAGTFEVTEEDGDIITGTLTLQGIQEYTPALVSAPAPAATLYQTQTLVDDWLTFNAQDDTEAATTTGLLQVGNLTITLTLSDPMFDDMEGVFTYTATVEDVFSTDSELDPKELVMPEEFENAVLFLLVDTDFATALRTGYEIRLDDPRETYVQDCNPILANCN